MQKKKNKKEKHIVGTKELIFDIVSLALIIILGIYIGFRSIKYYSKETSKKKIEKDTLVQAILNNNKITKSEKGLRKTNDGYYFIGNVENNYLKAFNRLYRIIEINNDNNVKIVSNSNETTMIYGNNNEYKNSNIYNWLNKNDDIYSGIYYNTIPGVEKLLEKTSYCIGTLKNNKVKCNSKTEKDYFTILDVDDYIRALGKKSYLNIGKFSFLLGKDKNSNPLILTDEGTVENSYNYEGYGIRIVMTLKKNALITGGTGTKEDPYVLNQEGFENNVNKYVKLGSDTYQIIEESSNWLRLRQNDYLNSNGIYKEIAFNNKEAEFNIKSKYNIGYYLNKTYLNSLPYQNYLSDCNFYTGEISTDTSYSYSEIFKENIIAKVGLLNMFDLNTNDTLTDYYLINKTSSVGSMVRTYNSLGIIDDDKANQEKKIVPVVCMDRNYIKSGDGSINNPYKVE